MSQAGAVLLGAVAGGTVFLGLPVARMHGLPKSVQGFLNAFATGILVFLLWDILTHAAGPVEAAIAQGQRGPFAAMAAIFAAGIGLGLLGLVYFNRTVFSQLRHGHATPSPRSLSLAIATGLGLHNLSEGLAIGESAHVGAIAFTGVLAIGFALHNITEGFGIAAPMTTEAKPASWGFLALAGLIGGGPTFIRTWISKRLSSMSWTPTLSRSGSRTWLGIASTTPRIWARTGLGTVLTPSRFISSRRQSTRSVALSMRWKA